MKNNTMCVRAVMVSMSGEAWSEISRGTAVKHFVVAALWYFLSGGCIDVFCGGYLDIIWHLLGSCFTAFLRRAAFTAYFEAAFFAAFLVVDASRHFLGGAAWRHFWRGGLERPLRSLRIKTITVCVDNCVECCSYSYCYVANLISLNLLRCRHFAMSLNLLFSNISGLASKIASFSDKQRLHCFISHLYAVALHAIDHFMPGL